LCQECSVEQERAESQIIMAMCGSLGVAATGFTRFGYGDDADKAYVVDYCRIAFNDRTDAEIDARMKELLKRARELMLPPEMLRACVNVTIGRSSWHIAGQRAGQLNLFCRPDTVPKEGIPP
jgi:hypothetical protein